MADDELFNIDEPVVEPVLNPELEQSATEDILSIDDNLFGTDSETEREKELETELKNEVEIERQSEQSTDDSASEEAIIQERTMDFLTINQALYDTEDTRSTWSDPVVPPSDPVVPPYLDPDQSKWGPLREPEKSNNMPAMIALMVMFIIVVGLCIFIAARLSKGISFSGPKKDEVYKTEDGSDPWSEIFKDKEANGEQQQDADKSSSDIDEASSEKEGQTAFDNRDRDAYANEEYYEVFADCIDENVPYEIYKNWDLYSESSSRVEISSVFVQINGNIPNIEMINQRLKDESLSYRNRYEEYMNAQEPYINDSDQEWRRVEVMTYVTYNDEQTLSICIQDEAGRLRGVIVDLVAGAVLENTQVLHLDDSFASEFRERSERQNGHVSVMGNLTDEMIMKLLRSDETLILFYTPVGLELGFDYEYDGYSGWVTISLKEYEQYLNNL